MNIIKKLLQTSITILAIAGMVLMSTPASAGFFDWFGATPLSQEAAAVKSLKTDSSSSKSQVSTKTVIELENKALQSVKIAEEKKPSAVSSFFNTFFSRKTAEPATSKSVIVPNDPTIQVVNNRTNMMPPVNISSQNNPPSIISENISSQIDGGVNTEPTVSVVSQIKYSYFENTIRYKDYGADVKKLQSVLTDAGYYNDKIDASYGRNTVEAVRNFQRLGEPKQNLTSGRVVGPKTLFKLNALVDELNGGVALGGGSCPTPAQSDAIIGLLNSFGVNQLTIEQMESLLNGGPILSIQPGSGLNQSQIEAILGLLTSFNCSQSIIDGASQILNGSQIENLG